MTSRSQSARRLLAMLTLACAGSSGGAVPQDAALRAVQAVYHIDGPKHELGEEPFAKVKAQSRDADGRRGEWRERDKRVVLNLPFIHPAPRVRGRPDLRRWTLPIQITLRNPAALGARRTRITLWWSAMKSGWSEQQVGLDVNGIRKVDYARAASSSVAGRGLSIEVPAVEVRRSDGLTIRISLGERTVPEAKRGIYADALELELLP